MESFDKKLFLSLTEGKTLPFTLELISETDSTNLDAKKRIESGLNGFALIVAERQTGGRGTKGRSFSSPSGGIYFSFILPVCEAGQLSRITPLAAVAAVRAATDVSGKNAEIKWVNDIFLEGKKVCGILCEAIPKGESWSVIIGVGADIYEPEGGFLPELSDIAGTLCGEPDERKMRECFVARFVSEMFRLLEVPAKELHKEYSHRCSTPGKEVYVIKKEKTDKALALNIAKDFRLVVKYGDNSTEELLSDEVSVRPVS